MKKLTGIFRLLHIMIFGFIMMDSMLVTAGNLSGNTFKTINYISKSHVAGSFVLAEDGKVSSILIDETDFPGVKRVAGHLQSDIKLVTGVETLVTNDKKKCTGNTIIVGTIGNSNLIDELIRNGKINVDDVKGKWEVSLIQVVDNPFPGIERGLVIAGSDKRGTIFGMFDLSAQMGVSPWYYWADVPVVPLSNIYVKPGRYNLGEPKVQYRGIFINDEEPALGGWVRETFGDFNADFYQKVYELILRMKGNFLWPAMWGKAHADDDPQNPILADEYGIVISYTHHEPMMRAHVEWSRYGKGPWNYITNPEVLKDFWREGIQRNGKNESFVTVGMRGDGDEPMSNERNIDLLTQIIGDQRQIIEQVTGKPASETPQLWALYKEVQEYYDMGMRVPDDIMLLYCDDNWGNVRRVPGQKELKRAGGSGMYYHFDYVGGPRNYKWTNTNPLPKIWEQMKLSYAHGIDRLWVVNVGDIKPVEFPIQFFLDLAWDPDRFGPEEIDEYTRLWVVQQFGEKFANEIAGFMAHYGKINGRRKPELLDWNTFPLNNYREFERVANEYNALANRASRINKQLDDKYKDAYYQLVLYPIEAGANIYNLYHATAKNHLYSKQGRALTNQLADSVRYYFNLDSLMTNAFHTELANGKWNHMMAQTRIGYTYWQQPPVNVIPKTNRIELLKGAHPELQVEGYNEVYSLAASTLPDFDLFNKQSHYFELFNKGDKAFNFSVKPSVKWVKLSTTKGSVNDQLRIFVSIDWAKMPVGKHNGFITVKAGKQSYKINLKAWNPSLAEQQNIRGFIEANGYVSMEAADFDKLNETGDVKWMVVPDIGRTGCGVMPHSYLVEEQAPGNGPSIEYPVFLSTTGEVTVYAYFSPTLNYTGGEGFKYAMSFNNETPQVVNIHADESMRAWEKSVANNAVMHKTVHTINKTGNQTLKFHMVSPGLVLQKIVIDTGGLKPTYLGPEPSFKKP